MLQCVPKTTHKSSVQRLGLLPKHQLRQPLAASLMLLWQLPLLGLFGGITPVHQQEKQSGPEPEMGECFAFFTFFFFLLPSAYFRNIHSPPLL